MSKPTSGPARPAGRSDAGVRLAHGFAARQRLAVWLGGAPAVLLALLYIGSQPWLIYPKLLLGLLCVGAWLGAAQWLYWRAEHQRLLLGNLIEGLALGDYSQRLRQDGPDDLLGAQLNALVDRLHEQRQQALLASGLADNVLRQLDVAVFAFDAKRQLRLANPSALQLLRAEAPVVLGRSAAALNLECLLEAQEQLPFEQVFAGAAGLWQLRRQHYLAAGEAQTLVFLSDLQQVLRHQELQAWQRLLRVLSHEVNNSLTPMASLSATIAATLRKHPSLSSEQQADLQEALTLIGERARHLGEFVRRHAQLARAPEPHKLPLDLYALLRRLPALLPEAHLSLELEAPDAPLPFFGDVALLEQLFINLLKNGIEAGGAPLSLRVTRAPLQLRLLDQGHGLANPANLFVPFYTTKPGGSGIGLVLARQIAEAHQGQLQLLPRDDGPGTEARLSFAAGVSQGGCETIGPCKFPPPASSP